MFTAGTTEIADKETPNDGKSSDVKAWHVILISFGVLAVLILVVIIICHFKKNKVNSDTIDSSFGKNEGLMKEELI